MTVYQGSCHCGAVAYEAEVDLSHTVTCNCSRCQKLGSVLAFTPAANFNLLRGEESLTEYRFNRNIIAHLFCKVCGIQSFSRATMPDGRQMVAINANCLQGVEPRQLESTPHDGRSQ